MTYPETSPSKEAVTSALVAPIPVPTHGPGGSFAVLAKVHISTPPATVLAAVRNTNTWATWNTFCPSCSITSPPSSSSTSSSSTHLSPDLAPEAQNAPNSHEIGWLQKGTVATITYILSGGPSGSPGEQGIQVTVLDLDHVFEDGRTGCRIAWKSTGRAHWQLHSERVMEFVDDGEGGCEYICWETFAGVLGGACKIAVGGKLRGRFGDYARDVKGFVEGGSKVEKAEA